MAFTLPNREGEDQSIEGKARRAEGLFALRLLAGKLCESWEVIKNNFLSKFDGATLSREYEPLLDQTARDAVGLLKTYFGRANLVRSVRNEYAFHYDARGLVERVEQVIGDDEFDEFVAYLEQAQGNSFYLGSDIAVNVALFRGIAQEYGLSRWTEAAERLVADQLELSRALLDFMGGCFIVLCKRHFGTDLAALRLEEAELGEVPRIDEVGVPFFVSR